MLVVKTDLLSYRISDLEPANSEILVCDVYPFNRKKYTICVCYRPPDCQQFFDAFAQLLSKLESATRVCIIGDFNMPSIIGLRSLTLITLGNEFCIGISLLDVLSKAFEKQVYDKLFDSIKPHICKWQYKFLPGRSTVLNSFK